MTGNVHTATETRTADWGMTVPAAQSAPYHVRDKADLMECTNGERIWIILLDSSITRSKGSKSKAMNDVLRADPFDRQIVIEMYSPIKKDNILLP